MTYISSTDAAASNKRYISLTTSSPVAMASGFAQHSLVRPSDQIVILRVIDETRSSSVGDVMAALEGHIDPAGAVQALISAGVVAAEIRNGVLDQHTRRSPGRRCQGAVAGQPSRQRAAIPSRRPRGNSSRYEGTDTKKPLFNSL